MYEELRNAEEIDNKIVLRNNFFFPVEKHNTLLIRAADRHIFKLFEMIVLNKQSVEEWFYDCMIVAGPEGVGKVSYFRPFKFDMFSLEVNILLLL